MGNGQSGTALIQCLCTASLLVGSALHATPQPKSESSYGATAPSCTAGNTVVAKVVALDQTIWYNRLGSHLPGAMIFALERDVCPKGGKPLTNGLASCGSGELKAGEVMLKPYKRPRPMVLRVNEGQCLEVEFTNLLAEETSSALACSTNPDIACSPSTKNDVCPPVVPNSCTVPNTKPAQTCPRDGRTNCTCGGAAPNVANVPCKNDADCVLCLEKTTSTRQASVHIQGLEWTDQTAASPSCSKPPCNDGSWVGRNSNSLAAPGETIRYKLFAAQAGTFVLYSTGDTFTATPTTSAGANLLMTGDGGQLAMGLFGAVHVEPAGEGWEAEWYRSQVSREDLDAATTGVSPYGQPLVDYDAVYSNSANSPCFQQGTCRVGPVLDMKCNEASVKAGACGTNEIVHSDLTAIITGPSHGRFPAVAGQRNPVLESSYANPDRLQPFREITIMYHDGFRSSQAFGELYSQPVGTGNPLMPTLSSGSDRWGMNYGFAGIGNEIIANRLGVGPMGECTSCKYEEFFLSSWAVGDPAMVVDHPASTVRCSGNARYVCQGDTSDKGQACTYGKANDGTQGNNPKGCDCGLDYKCEEDQPPTRVLYPDDPSNVYHSYLSDHARFRVLHGGYDLHHLHHQHAHQWLHSPDTPNGDYTDSQSIGPGSGFTMEMVYNGGGNVNQTVGDSIFHCHFYPHFASGMWSLWRVHDVLERGTEVYPLSEPTNGGMVKKKARALPDGEIVTGTPIPAVVPLPTLPMAPMPAKVQLSDQGKLAGKIAEICDVHGENCISSQFPAGPGTAAYGDPAAGGARYENPGYPFFIPGLAGQRAPHPPMDFAYACMVGEDSTGESCVPGDGGPFDFNAPPGRGTCSDPDAVCAPLDGGLPRHIVEACDKTKSTECYESHDLNQTDYSKTLTSVQAFQLPEGGTKIEQVAMAAHGTRRLIDSVTPPVKTPPQGHEATCSPTCNRGVCAANSSVSCRSDADCFSTCTVNGYTVNRAEPELRPAQYIVNGLRPKQGAPYADPCIQYDLAGDPIPLLDHNTRYYRAADIQLDAVFNKEGWHYPQQRMISLWGDVRDTLDGKRPPEPLFFRSNSGECISYTLANLVPNVFELDDFQVRTPTDILGQHIHLVKFDVTSSDGAANGFNYEDGTFAPNEVTERIRAINNGTWKPLAGGPTKLAARDLPYFGPGPGGQWVGAQATVQRYYADPLLNGTRPHPGVDRTLRTVFTHDHFSPSTHQQAGLYAGLVIEPRGSKWFENESGKLFGGVAPGACTGPPPYPKFGCPIVNEGRPGDGGPTTWQAVIEVPAKDGRPSPASFREFLMMIQDSTLTYESFNDVPDPVAGQGFCSNDPKKTCVPATVTAKADLKSCGDPDAVCYAAGFCSDNQKSCRLATATMPDDVTSCENPEFATCNLVAGVPSLAGNGWQIAVEGFPTNPINPQGPLPGVPIPELITLSAASNNFSLNYRNEPLFPRITSTSTNPSATDLAFAYAKYGADGAAINRGYMRNHCEKQRNLYCAQDAYCRTCNQPNPPQKGTCAYDNTTPCTTQTQDTDCKADRCVLDGGFTGLANTLCLQGEPNCKVFPYSPLTLGLDYAADPSVNTDPFTPLLRAYAGDDIQLRVLMGAHINPHNFGLFGIDWLMEPSFVESGWRSSLVMGISEHFEMLAKVGTLSPGDYLYQGGAAAIEQAGGNWGILRAYPTDDPYVPPLKDLPQNPTGFPQRQIGVCPVGAPTVSYHVVATTAAQALPEKTLIYNHDHGSSAIEDPEALLYFNLDDLDCTGSNYQSCTLKKGKPVEPLVLRAAAGDCIRVTLYNAISSTYDAAGATNQVPVSVSSKVSTTVGLHPQLVSYDVTNGTGSNVGQNPVQTVAALGSAAPDCASPGLAGAGVNCRTYTWYAGNVDPQAGNPHIPIEFGAGNLMAADAINQFQHGLFGALVIEPHDWKKPTPTAAGMPSLGTSATIETSAGSFREFVVLTPDGLGSATGCKVPTGASQGTCWTDPSVSCTTHNAGTNCPPGTLVDPALGGSKIEAFNYHSNPLANRTCQSGSQEVSCVLSDQAQCGGQPCGESNVPIFEACAGEEVRFRFLHPGGINTNQVIEIYGHVWPEAPFESLTPEGCVPPTTQTNLHASARIGYADTCPSGAADKPSLNEWDGSRMGHGPGNHMDIVIAKAGGTFEVPGDYLVRSYPAMHFALGPWGIFRVQSCDGE